MIDTAIQRLNMIESQIRPSDVTDQRILRAMGNLPREDFLPPSQKSLAYLDIDQPYLLPGQKNAPARFLLAPRSLAKLIQLAKIEPTHRVLDIGCGTGYTAAVLSSLCHTLIALESDEVLARKASEILSSKGFKNITVVHGNLDTGYSEAEGFDVILLEGAVTRVPDTLFDQLKPGGRLVAILKEGGHGGRATLWLRNGDRVSSNTGFDVSVAKLLPGFETPKKFVF